MTRIITALFDTQADADAGGERVRQAGIEASNVTVHDKTSHTATGEYSNRSDQGLWATIKSAVLPDHDRHTYEEGVRRGGFLLTVEAEDDDAGKVVGALEGANTIDLDQRSQDWRASGWDYQPNSDDSDDDGFVFAERDSANSTGRFRTYGNSARSD